MEKKDPMQQTLPGFRKELKLYRGPNEPSGAPTFNLFDPVRSKYYKITWEQSLIFEFFKAGMTPQEIVDQINKNTTITVTGKEVLIFFQGMAQYGLLKQRKESETLLEEVKKGRMNPIKWLLLHYLYIRVPLINPDKFLSETLHLVRPLVSKLAYTIYILLSVVGIAMLIPRFDEYLGTFNYFFSLEGLVLYALAIIWVKVIHELAHAYTAKYYGIYVPRMGILFLVLFPAMFTDVTHGWSLKNRRHRLAITLAGIYSELLIAGMATFFWAITPPGVLQSIFFLISSSTWLTSLLINLNPALKFDGYYLLSDLWGIDNLQPKSFQVARWNLRKLLLGLNAPCPDVNLSKRRIRSMTIYAIYCWIYRIFLYTAIALLVYYKFTKTLGVLLFATEILVFFIWPVMWEFQELKKLRGYFTKNPRILATTTILAVLLIYFIFPLPHQVHFNAITAPRVEQVFFAPSSAKIEELHATRGSELKKDTVAVRLSSVELDQEIAMQEREVKILETTVNILSQKDKERTLLAEKRAELGQAEEKLSSLLEKRANLSVKTEFDGKIIDWDIVLKEGTYVQENQVIGRLSPTGEVNLFFFIPEDEIDTVTEGQRVTFITPLPRKRYFGRVSNIQPLRANILNYPPLASVFEGELLTTMTEEGDLKLHDSYYIAEATLDTKEPLKYGLSGEAELRGPWRSLMMQFIRTVQRVLLRESGT